MKAFRKHNFSFEGRFGRGMNSDRRAFAHLAIILHLEITTRSRMRIIPIKSYQILILSWDGLPFSLGFHFLGLYVS
ncbi:hypothetical protein CKAN_02729500 [Cinnamomum micranthum f. kanehirae]|uniref:Uncharacterized protein n=1 Tax=Cinnamomum micranthum f. kanehirae TaxID=337451 RepID=A0A3S3NSI9_9MAGN|nr:hypothetical protein CKAN_02729500 [Cinnamomum micranthum f. kanehirae]